MTGLAGIYTDPGQVIAYRDGTVLQEFSVLLHARAVGGDAWADGTETAVVRWVDPAELPELDLHPVMRRRIADALNSDGAPDRSSHRRRGTGRIPPVRLSRSRTVDGCRRISRDSTLTACPDRHRRHTSSTSPATTPSAPSTTTPSPRPK